ncbi:Pimeloyl-ACP methyl ester carboxylesterase [Fontimonas thermophila]|uniref:Pimeloyl-ACP methyl ester carboxylesterase n=1 Tax=Fontimonas thermophila TaxID=1076937 RepID=A0A1I2J8T9_9GAMM|nr:alpha/beta hydrolase [Fontimonas thermophila]SFF49111.1 Pimeloyl-ACP methyl ester carboxylesterase [Fontimonas thermophila]
MNDRSLSDYLAATIPWTSSAGTGPVLRGRRTALRTPMLHFLHGNGFCGGVYWPFLRHFIGDYGLFCHDLEGHGGSDAPARYSGTAAIIARVPLVIADQRLPQPLVGIGHSFGAAVTLAVAARHPGLFRALVLLDPILLPPRDWLAVKLASWLRRNPMAESARRRRERWSSRAQALEHLRDRGIYRNWRSEALEAFVDHATRDDGSGARALCCPRDLEAAIFENPVYPWRLPPVPCPILFVHGEHSYPFFPAAARRMMHRHPHITLRTLPGGHCFMQEDPDTAADTVSRFLRAL